MPIGTAAATHLHGQEAMDINVLLSIVKKGLVLIPVFIMLILFFIRISLTYDDDSKLDHGNSTANPDLRNSSN